MKTELSTDNAQVQIPERDQEFVLAFETDNPADFSELVMELRSSEASRYTAVEVPLFTCVAMNITERLNLLG
jgi:chlorite dismutase